MTRALAVPLIALLAGCGSAGGEVAWPGAVCAERLPDVTWPAVTEVAWTAPRSRVVVDVRVDAGAIVTALERAVPKRVVDQRKIDAGSAGRMDIVVDRGPFAVSLAGDELAIEVDLAGEASLCKPLGPFGCVHLASCRPGAHARAAVSLVLGPGLTLAPSKVAIPVTRPCTLTALNVDVTGRVQHEADVRAQSIRAEIDRGVPVVYPLASELWNALGASVPVGAGACARVHPTALIQSGPRRDGDAVALGLGVEGEVVVETPCAPAVRSGPMPPPTLDRGAAPGVELAIPVMASWGEVGHAVARALAGTEIHAGREVVRITDATIEPAGAAARVVVTIAGRSCGRVAFVGSPVADAVGEVRFPSLAPEIGEVERAKAAAPGLDVDALARAVAEKLRLPPRLDVAAVPRRIDRTARALLPHDDAGPDVEVTMRDARIERAEVTPRGLSVVLVATGSATVRLR